MPLEEEAHAFASAELDVQDGNVRLVRIRQTGGRIDVVSGPHAGQLPGCLYGDGESLVLGGDGLVELAESQGWHAQSTSVPGVAQRTGSTLYYVEMLPPKGGRAPILSLMPAPGEVDVVLAAELAEAGRSILRGLVTPDRSTLHRGKFPRQKSTRDSTPGGFRHGNDDRK